MKVNNKGFTLIELLAAMVILAAIMVVAVPNVMGILNNSKADTSVEDAKKLLSLAEYEFRGNPAYRPPQNDCVVMTLGYLDNTEFDNAPNNGNYEKDNSYVIIVNTPEAGTTKNRYLYYVTLDEKMDTDNHRGILYKSSDELNSSDASDLITNGTGTNILASSNTAKSHVGCNNITKIYTTADAAST